MVNLKPVLMTAVTLLTSGSSMVSTADELNFFTGAGVGYTSVYDKAGDVNPSISPLLLVGMRYGLTRTTNLKLEAFYLSASPSSDFDHIAQDFLAYGLSTEYQISYVYSRNIRPRFGIGLSVQKEKVSDRYTVDEFGYLVENLGDDSRIGVGVVVSSEFDFNIDKSKFTTGLKYTYGVNSASNLAAYLDYNF